MDLWRKIGRRTGAVPGRREKIHGKNAGVQNGCACDRRDDLAFDETDEGILHGPDQSPEIEIRFELPMRQPKNGERRQGSRTYATAG